MGGFNFSAFFFRINTIRGTVFLEFFGPRSLPGAGAAFAPGGQESREAQDEGGIEAFRSPELRRERLTAKRPGNGAAMP
jgi:hypothetical protein